MCLYLGWGYKQLQSFQDLSTKSRQKKFWNTFSLLKCGDCCDYNLTVDTFCNILKKLYCKKNNLEKL